MTLRVRRAGPLTTIQDLGRPGYGSAGIPVSGAFDLDAFRLANRLVSNLDSVAALEMTLSGATIETTGDHVVALAGARFEAAVEGGSAAPYGEAFRLPEGATLTVGRAVAGARMYLAVRGGIACVPVFGSTATNVAARLGGIQGRPLADGDLLEVAPASDAPLRCMSGRHEAWTPLETLRVVLGPYEDALTSAGLEALLRGPWRVSARSNRAGVRLEGDPLESRHVSEAEPHGLVVGVIQVAGDGRPIIIGPDGPATGGYPVVAAVIAADISALAQARPGDTLRFSAVSVSDARQALRTRQGALHTAIEVMS